MRFRRLFRSLDIFGHLVWIIPKSLIIHEQNTKEIIAVKESLYVIKHTCIFTKLLPQISRLIQHIDVKQDGYKMDRF